MSRPRIYADLQGLVGSGAPGKTGVVLIDSWGSARDLAALGLRLSDGLQLTLYDDGGARGGNEFDATAHFDAVRGGWYGQPDGPGCRAIATRSTKEPPTRFRCIKCEVVHGDVPPECFSWSGSIRPDALKYGPRCPDCGALLASSLAPPPGPGAGGSSPADSRTHAAPQTPATPVLTSSADLDRELATLFAPLLRHRDESPFTVALLRSRLAERFGETYATTARPVAGGSTTRWTIVTFLAHPAFPAVFAVAVAAPDALTVFGGIGMHKKVMALAGRFTETQVGPALASFMESHRVDARELSIPRKLAGDWLASASASRASAPAAQPSGQ